MKIQSTGHAVESSGIQASSTFSIKTSGHAFQMLSSGLYTNKVQAVVRELACNAADAHVAAGRNDVPFEVKIPNKLDSQFYIKDFGTGLTEEQVMRLYTTYFESTKSASNAFTGGFGLGSKSPFAYTDSFTVESRQHGVKTIFTAFVGEDNVPQIAKLDSFETAEPDGLTVGFPVKPDDVGAFTEEVNNVLHWFSAPANVIGAVNSHVVRFDDPSVRTFAYRSDFYGIEGEHWTPLKHSSQRMQGGKPVLRRNNAKGLENLATVIMGNVHYPLTMQSDWRGDVVVEWWNTVKPFLFVPIGLFSVAVSREALAYDKSTQRSVLKFLKDAFVDFAKTTAKELDRIVEKFSGLEQHQKARQYLMSLGMNEGKIVSAYLDAISATAELRAVVAVRDILPFQPKTFDLILVDAYQNKLESPHAWARKQQRSGHTVIDPLKDYFIIENAGSAFGLEADHAYNRLLEKNANGRSTYHITKFMIVPHRGKAATDEYEAELIEWKKVTGFEVTPFTGVDVAKGAVHRIPARRYTGSWHWEEAILTESHDEFFWTTEKEWEKFGKERGYELQGFIKNLDLPEIQKRLYLISSADVGVVKEHMPNQKHFFDTFAELLNHPKMVKKIDKIKPMLSGTSSAFSRMRSRYKNEPVWQAEMANTEIGKWVEKMKNTKGPASYDFATTRILASFKKVLGDKLNAPVPEYYDGQKIQKTFIEQYPLLHMHLDEKSVVTPEMVKHMVAYVNWCEANGAKPPLQEMDFDTPNP